MYICGGYKSMGHKSKMVEKKIEFLFAFFLQSYLQAHQINIKMPSYGLLNFIDERKLKYTGLSTNPNAIQLLEKNQDKINWMMLTKNPAAVQDLAQLSRCACQCC